MPLKLICKIRQNFRESTLGKTFIVHGDTKKNKCHSDGMLRNPLRAGLQNEFQPQPGLVHQLGSVQPVTFPALSQILMNYCLHVSFFL